MVLENFVSQCVSIANWTKPTYLGIAYDWRSSREEDPRRSPAAHASVLITLRNGSTNPGASGSATTATSAGDKHFPFVISDFHCRTHRISKCLNQMKNGKWQMENAQSLP